MKTILKSTLLLLGAAFMFAACSDDRDANPVLTAPSEFVLNTPAIANNNIDLANSETITLTTSQPNYGFPASTRYKVQVATKADMSNAKELSAIESATVINVDAAELASTLTSIYLEGDETLTEDDFPKNHIPVYLRLKAYMITSTGNAVDGTEVLSNVVTLKDVNLRYSLAPVTAPEHVYLVGNFNDWKWDDTAPEMVHVYGTDNVYWRLVWIDDAGIKFNSDKSWDGNEVGFAGITINAESELGDKIVESGGNIAATETGWYLMVVTATVEGRNILYDVTFNKPEVWLIGSVTPTSGWDEKMDGCLFSIPTAKDGEFVSPAFANDAAEDSGVRAYVKVPGYDWWKSEFMVFDKKIEYRGTGGDQDRVVASAGQKLYLNFSNDTGDIK